MSDHKLARLLIDAALHLQEVPGHVIVVVDVERDLEVELPDASVCERVFVSNVREPYVIRTTQSKIGRVTISVNGGARPATATDMESAGQWDEIASNYRVGRLQPRSAP